MTDRPILIEMPETLVGPRVVVRPYAEADVEALFGAIQESIEHLRPWLPWYDQHKSVDDTLEFVRRTRARWLLRESFGMGIFLGADDSFLGGCGLQVHNWKVPSFEIGYWLRATAEGHGYMTEAVRLLTSFAFEVLHAQRVMIRCDDRNTRSKAIPERLGYVFEGCMRNAEIGTSGEPFNALVYSMIPDEYGKARGAS